MRHLQGLDAIRLFAASVVVISHFSLDLTNDLLFLGPVAADRTAKVIGLFWNGQAAVIVFFVISGFVIHYPHATGRRFDLTEYYTRRFVRLLPPAVIAGAGFMWLDLVPSPEGWNGTIFWSLICEIIYYALYPLMRAILSRNILRLHTILAASVLAAAIVFLANLETVARDSNYPSLGYLTWVCGLPCWLAGCWLAENLDRFRPLTDRRLWLARVGIVGLGGTLTFARYSPEVLGVLTSNIFLFNMSLPAIVAWLGFEIARLRPTAGTSWEARFDRLGAASYSLYLTHMFAFAAIDFPVRNLANFPLYLIAAALVACLFHFAVERPFHGFARALGRRNNRAV